MADAKALRVQAAKLRLQATQTTDKKQKAALQAQARQISAQASLSAAQTSQSNAKTSAVKRAAAKIKSAASKAKSSAKKNAASAAKSKLIGQQNATQAGLAKQLTRINAYNQNANAQAQHVLPKGATAWKHNWVPVDSNGKPVGPSQKNTPPPKKKPVAAGQKGGRSGGITMSNEMDLAGPQRYKHGWIKIGAQVETPHGPAKVLSAPTPDNPKVKVKLDNPPGKTTGDAVKTLDASQVHAGTGAKARVAKEQAKRKGLNTSNEDKLAIELAVPLNLRARARAAAAKKGQALPDGSFPIRNKVQLQKAKRAIGRAKPSKRAKVKAFIAKRAKALGASKGK